MKKLILLLLLPNLVLGQKLREAVKIKTPIYEVVYNEKLEQPTKIQYTVQCPNGTASRAGMDFYTNDSIKTSDADDYVNNVYDKGHLAPAADFNCTKEILYQTFSYLNCALQNQYLNRGVWRMLEEHERELARTENVTVTITLVFDKNSIVLPTGATVPNGFYKTIYSEKTKKTIKYYFANENPTKPKYTDYLIK
jgi:endonuclease G, mitochondrial